MVLTNKMTSGGIAVTKERTGETPEFTGSVSWDGNIYLGDHEGYKLYAQTGVVTIPRSELEKAVSYGWKLVVSLRGDDNRDLVVVDREEVRTKPVYPKVKSGDLFRLKPRHDIVQSTPTQYYLTILADDNMIAYRMHASLEAADMARLISQSVFHEKFEVIPNVGDTR